ncbi:hypothetical protein CcCBS67573_g05478 [Chytriomyces confervae]|uniref:MFS-type drug efflux transporter P55 n=1 Tax=Chytriomyces confervae TaxID=246404 RepID=A0A507FCF7_9FUNG|nr:hypothetical protein CcCBS67573_g05478 [Chytriomyces confervae]
MFEQAAPHPPSAKTDEQSEDCTPVRTSSREQGEQPIQTDPIQSQTSTVEVPSGGEGGSKGVEADEDAAKVPLTGAKFTLVMFALLCGVAMASLDGTIVATAIKAVVAELGRQELVPWIGSTYLMSAAITCSLCGKLADLFGRKLVFLLALSLFTLGSAGAGAAQSMSILIGARAVQGLGGGGIFTLAIIIIAEIVPTRKRSIYLGLMTAVFGFSSVIGPLVGGALSDHVSWRWCFLINIPIGLLTIIAVMVFLPFPSPAGTFMQKMAKLDILGALLLSSAIVCFLTPLQLGGSTWEWNSVQVIALFIVSLVQILAFIYVELRVASEPIIPATLFCNSSSPAILGIAIMLGATFFTSLYYMSLFFQITNGDTATQAGVKLIPLMVGFSGASVLTGIFISRTQRYVALFYVGPILAILGGVFMALLTPSSKAYESVLSLGVFGIGTGVLVQVRTFGAQISVPRELLATASAVAQTCNAIGGSVGVAIAGTLFNNVIHAQVASNPVLIEAIRQLEARGVSVDPTSVLAFIRELVVLPDAGLANAELLQVFNHAFKVTYLSLLVYPTLILLLALFVREFPCRVKTDAETVEV